MMSTQPDNHYSVCEWWESDGIRESWRIWMDLGSKEDRSEAQCFDLLLKRCPRLPFYSGRLLDLRKARTKPDLEAAIASLDGWLKGCPRPGSRKTALESHDDDSERNLILFGGQSGTGKTTVAHERILARLMLGNMRVEDPEWWMHDPSELPLALTGHELFRRTSKRAAANELDDWMGELTAASVLLIDDVDKRAGSDGKLSSTCQQAFFDLVDYRVTNRDKITLLTMNSTGAEFASRFDPETIAPYLMRRLKEQFRAIPFDEA